MPYGTGYQKTVKTAQTAKVHKTATDPDKMAKKFGNAGNTKGTRLPKGGCARGAKKMTSRKGRSY